MTTVTHIWISFWGSKFTSIACLSMSIIMTFRSCYFIYLFCYLLQTFYRTYSRWCKSAILFVRCYKNSITLSLFWSRIRMCRNCYTTFLSWWSESWNATTLETFANKDMERFHWFSCNVEVLCSCYGVSKWTFCVF